MVEKEISGLSAPRILLAPTHRTELANALAATISEAVARQGRSVRYHHLGVLPPPLIWSQPGRWQAPCGVSEQVESSVRTNQRSPFPPFRLPDLTSGLSLIHI